MRALAVVAILLALPAGLAVGQWRVGLEIATTRYGGSAHDTSNGGGPPTYRPGDAMMIGVRLERVIGRVGAGLRASIGKPGLAVGGGD
ncbi:MAG: hypothetical protein ACRDHY_12610, partial [Anaerolineales bacterium]